MKFSILVVGIAVIAQDFSRLDPLITQEMFSQKVPGAAMAVVRSDKVIYSRGIGTANADTAEPVRADMLFRVGSTTKMMTAAALVKLTLAGRIGLNEPIGGKLPHLPQVLHSLTVNQLLSHTAGLIPDTAMSGSHDDEALERNVLSWGPERFLAKREFPYSYSNHGYALAGYIVEKLARKPFADAVAEMIFAPAGMPRTTFRPLIAITWPVAQGHDQEGHVIRPVADAAGFWPAGSMFTSALDFANFLIAFLNSRAPVNASVVQAMTTPHADIPKQSGVHYGYGLLLDTYRGVRRWHHAGARAGYTSHVVMAPDQKIGIVLLMNRSGAALPKTLERLQEIALPLQ